MYSRDSAFGPPVQLRGYSAGGGSVVNLVADATENFRRTLDGFPSKYMWGGWNTDKEQVREKAAQAVGMMTAFVPRPLEFGTELKENIDPEPWLDIFANNFLDLSDKLET